MLSALRTVTAEAGIEPSNVRVIIHGTTLATNALIERKGAKTALLTTEGFRDVVEIRHENRFEQYDVNIDLPPPLVPRRWRLPIRERVDARGKILVDLGKQSVSRAIETPAAEKIQAVAVGFLHSFTAPENFVWSSIPLISPLFKTGTGPATPGPFPFQVRARAA